MNGLGAATIPPHLASGRPHALVGVLEGTFADRHRCRGVEIGCRLEDLAADAGVVFLEHLAHELAGEGHLIPTTPPLRLLRLLLERLDPLFGRWAVLLRQPRFLLTIAPWAPAGAARRGEQGHEEAGQ